MINKVFIWDLDGTVINSFHRVSPCLKDNGDLDLDMYRNQACVHNAIMEDTLLPLAEYMRFSLNNPSSVNIIVTARAMGKSDYYFLRKQGLRGRSGSNVRVMSRDTLHKYTDSLDDVMPLYKSSDAEYKRFYFGIVSKLYPDADVTVFDDHKGVLKVANEMGFSTVDATLLNDILSIGVRTALEEYIDESLADDSDYSHLCDKANFIYESMTTEEREELTSPSQLLIQAIAS